MSDSQAKVAIVTGAGSGIGRLVAEMMLDDGYSVALAGRRQEALDAVVARFPGGKALAIGTDVANPKSVEKLFATTVTTFGRLDVLFNNAGMLGTPGPVENVAFEDWERVIATNITGSFLCAQQAFRCMKEQNPQGGRIINNGSLSAHVPRPHTVAYATSKHAISGLTRTLALEGRRANIACGQIDIGNALTEMASMVKSGSMQADGSIQVEPTMDPRNVARMVMQMASLPLNANVFSISIMATGMPYVGRG